MTFDETLRKYATQTTMALSLVVGVTGVMMFYHFYKGEVEALHEWLGLAFVAWSPLGGYRKPLDEPKFAPFQKIADARGISRAQVILAWELARAPHVIPIPGSHRTATILDSLKAADLELTDAELASLG